MGTPIQVGQKAPDFTLKDQDKNDVTLSSFRGKKNVVLAFFPMAFSSFCSSENACFQSDMAQFNHLDAQLLGISIDSVYAQKAFADKLGVKYPLLADFHPKGAAASKFGLYLEDAGFTNRATVIVDKEGVVRYVKTYDIPSQRDNKEIVQALEGLKQPAGAR